MATAVYSSSTGVSCAVSKSAYVNLADALTMALVTAIDSGLRVFVYECPNCYRLHLTRTRPVEHAIDAGWTYTGRQRHNTWQ